MSRGPGLSYLTGGVGLSLTGLTCSGESEVGYYDQRDVVNRAHPIKQGALVNKTSDT